MVQITARYEGSLHCNVRHGPSDATISTDAPVDNHGLGQAFSPTDLVGAALVTCAMTVMGIAAKRADVKLDGMTARVEKGMVADPLRRIGSLPVVISIPGALSAEQKETLEAAARQCPVASSLRADIEMSMTFEYPDAE